MVPLGPPVTLPEEPQPTDDKQMGDDELIRADDIDLEGIDVFDFSFDDLDDFEPASNVQFIQMSKKEKPMSTFSEQKGPRAAAPIGAQPIPIKVQPTPSAISQWVSAQSAKARAFFAATYVQFEELCKTVISVVSMSLFLALVTWGVLALLERAEVKQSLSYDHTQAWANVIGIISIMIILWLSLSYPGSWRRLSQLGLSMLVLQMMDAQRSPLVFLSIFPMYNIYIAVTIMLTATYAIMSFKPQLFAQSR